MTTEQLARRVLAVLDTQRSYFRSRRQDDLENSKRLERELRRDCEEIVAGPLLPLIDEGAPTQQQARDALPTAAEQLHEIIQHVQWLTPDHITPDHACDYVWDPLRGHCDFCEHFYGLMYLCGVEEYLYQEMPDTPETEGGEP